MKIIIVGCGKVGATLTAQLCRENHNITIIDSDYNVVKNVSNTYDVLGIAGNGVGYSVLQEADIEHADLLIAVTRNDELNILCCVIAKQAANCQTIARVRNPVYREEAEFIRRELGISMIINPEFAAAQEIARLLRFPSAIEIDTFSKGRVEMLRFKVPEKSSLDGITLKDFPRKFQNEVLICAAEANGTVTIPDGNFTIHSGNILSIIASAENASRFFRQIGVRTNQVHSTMIVGGGSISYYLASMLLRMGIDVKIIEANRERCEQLAEYFPTATIIHGDGSDETLLKEENIEDTDSFVAATGLDEENIILSLYAQKQASAKVITKINHLDFTDVINTLNLDSLIYPKHITAEYILQYVRAMANSIGSNVETLYKLMDDRVEALEFTISSQCKLVGIPLKDMKTKPNLLVAGISRKGQLIIPGGQDSFCPGDSVVIVTTINGLQDIHDIVSE